VNLRKIQLTYLFCFTRNCVRMNNDGFIFNLIHDFIGSFVRNIYSLVNRELIKQGMFLQIQTVRLKKLILDKKTDLHVVYTVLCMNIMVTVFIGV
jgi:hypothetical protein